MTHFFPKTRRALAAPLMLALTLALPGPAAALEQKLTAADGAASDKFGSSVAIDGDTAVVGAPEENDGRGAVYVFLRSADSWTQTAKLTASDGAAYDYLGWSVAIEGDTIVAGAIRDRIGPNLDQGSAYTFARTGAAARNQTAKLTASDGAAYDNLGWSVAIEGDTIVAGAYGDKVGPDPYQGSAYTFARTGAAARTETAKLTASDGAAFASLGVSVAIEGDTIVASAYTDDIGWNTAQGSAYTFARTGPAARTETAKLTASDGAAGDGLGASVAIEGDTIVAGAPYALGPNADQGSAYTFARTGAAARTETAKLTASDGAGDRELGASVAIDGDTIVAGAPNDGIGPNTYQGSVYTFARAGAAARTHTAKLAASGGAADDLLGTSVAIGGDTIVAGAPGHSIGPNEEQGSAWIDPSPAPVPPAAGSPPKGAGPPHLFGWGSQARPKPKREAGACANTKRGTGASETLAGTGAGDQLLGRGGSDLLSGLAGDDCLFGGPGRDKLSGGSGKDTLTGGAGNDKLTGGAGKDKLTGAGGRNSYSAGSGSDTVNARNGKRERVDCGPGRDSASLDRSDRARSCERVTRR